MNKKKTRYCEHYLICDRDEDCFNGEYCPVFQFNPECSTIKNEKPPDWEKSMDKIWEEESD